MLSAAFVNQLQITYGGPKTNVYTGPTEGLTHQSLALKANMSWGGWGVYAGLQKYLGGEENFGASCEALKYDATICGCFAYACREANFGALRLGGQNLPRVALYGPPEYYTMRLRLFRARTS